MRPKINSYHAENKRKRDIAFQNQTNGMWHRRKFVKYTQQHKVIWLTLGLIKIERSQKKFRTFFCANFVQQLASTCKRAFGAGTQLWNINSRTNHAFLAHILKCQCHSVTRYLGDAISFRNFIAVTIINIS